MDIITNTAELSCNQGTTKSKLIAISQDFVTIEDKPIATEENKQMYERIFSLFIQNKYFVFSLYLGKAVYMELVGEELDKILVSLCLGFRFYNGIEENHSFLAENFL